MRHQTRQAKWLIWVGITLVLLGSAGVLITTCWLWWVMR